MVLFYNVCCFVAKRFFENSRPSTELDIQDIYFYRILICSDYTTIIQYNTIQYNKPVTILE